MLARPFVVGSLALLVALAAPRAQAQQQTFVIPGGMEEEILGLVKPFTLMEEVTAGWTLANVRIEARAIHYELEGPTGQAALTLRHPSRADRGDPSALDQRERTRSFLAQRTRRPGATAALNHLVGAIRKNDTGSFWKRAEAGTGTSRSRTSGLPRLLAWLMAMAIAVVAWLRLAAEGQSRVAPLPPADPPAPWPRGWWLWIPAVGIVAGFYAWLDLNHGVVIDGDSLRDITAALGIRDGRPRPPGGPWLGGPDAALSAIYYYFLAIPLLFSRSLEALVAWQVVWQTATVVVLYSTLRRLFQARIAVITTALFVFAANAAVTYAHFTHSNYVFFFSVVVIRCLYEVQCRGRSWFLVPGLGALALGAQFHITTLMLLPLVLAASIVGGRGVRWYQALAALFAALVPFLPSNDTWNPEEFLAGGLSYVVRLVERNNAVAPAVIVALIVVAPAALRTLRGWAFAALVLAAWAGWIVSLRVTSGKTPVLQLLNLKAGGDSQEQQWQFARAADVLLHKVVSLAIVSPDQPGLVFWGLVIVGFVTVVHRWVMGLRAGEAAMSPASAPLFLAGGWLVTTFPLAFALLSTGPELHRYFAMALLPSLLLFAFGTEALLPGADRPRLMRHVAGVLRTGLATALAAGAMLPAAFAVVLPRPREGSTRLWTALVAAGAIVAGAVFVRSWRSDETVPFTAYRQSAALLDALTDRLGLDGTGIARRVHGVADHRWLAVDGRATPLLFLMEVAPPRVATAPASLHHLVLPPDEVPAGSVELIPQRLSAWSYRPAVRTDMAELIDWGDPEYEGGPLSMPFRALFASAPKTLRYATSEDWINLRREEPGTLRIAIPREVPQDPALAGVEVLVGTKMVHDARCEVALALDGEPLPLQRRTGDGARRYRFLMPQHEQPVRLELEVTDCRVFYLDVYDVPDVSDYSSRFSSR